MATVPLALLEQSSSLPTSSPSQSASARAVGRDQPEPDPLRRASFSATPELVLSPNNRGDRQSHPRPGAGQRTSRTGRGSTHFYERRSRRDSYAVDSTTLSLLRCTKVRRQVAH